MTLFFVYLVLGVYIRNTLKCPKITVFTGVKKAFEQYVSNAF